MTRWLRLSLGLLALSLSACATLTPQQAERAVTVAAAAQSRQLDCEAANACAQPSALRGLADRAFAESTPQQPRHYALILDAGTDALLARVNLIRSATSSIDVQTYIYDEDDAGRLVLDELLAAARRGVRVRLLMDQLAAIGNLDTLAALAGAHVNFEVRLYNPMLGRARISYPQYLLAGLCCWRKLNQRMHSKLLTIDDRVAIAGGRNYQNDYYDWDGEYNFRDRDVLVAGPTAGDMAADFDGFWADQRSVPLPRLRDIGRALLTEGVPALPPARFERPWRAAALVRDAGDAALVQERLVARALPVGAVDYVSDSPAKYDQPVDDHTGASHSLRGLIESANREVLLQTPYLVLSEPAQDMFRALRRRPDPPRVIISTNSLAATDAFIAYALSYKYKRRYLREFGFNIYEYKPFPLDAPVDIAATGAELPPWPAADAAVADSASEATTGVEPAPRQRRDTRSVVRRSPRYRQPTKPMMREDVALRFGSRAANEPVPLKRAGVRIGMHAKSLVIDERIGVIGTHNFDPRGDRYNTEAAVVIEDPAFARELAASIRRDIAPANSWVIARRDKLPVLSGLEYSLGKLSEHLPLFDLWPTRYATSYEFVPGPECPRPLPPDAPGFRACHVPVGDFPEVALGLKSVTTRIFTAFGAGLAPIL